VLTDTALWGVGSCKKDRIKCCCCCGFEVLVEGRFEVLVVACNSSGSWCKQMVLPCVSMRSGTYISQNRDKMGLRIFWMFSTIMKNRVLLLYISMLLRRADWASMVSLSAFCRTMILNSSFLDFGVWVWVFGMTYWTLILAKFLISHRMNWMPFSCAQLTYRTLFSIRFWSWSRISRMN